MEGAQTSPQPGAQDEARPQARIWSWADEVFKSIIDTVVSGKRDHVFDVSAPPGTRKTWSVVRYILEKRLNAVISPPYHQTQQTILNYILALLERMKVMKLKQFVVDYAGIENYCLFYRPEVLARVLDNFRSSPRQPYEEAARSMLADDVVFSVMMAKGVADVEWAWEEVARALDRYKATGDRRGYVSAVSQVVERKGQYEVCTSVCPLGLFAWLRRRDLYKFFSEPKVITWRRMREDVMKSKMPRAWKHVVYANPDAFAENFRRILRGEFKPEWALCPRYILMTRISESPRSSKPVFISTRKFIILTPHAGLQFVMETVRRQRDMMKAKGRRPLLFLDEYDAFLKPVSWPLVSVEAVKAAIAVAEKVAGSRVGDTVKGVEVDAYLKRYAVYVRDTLARVLEVFEESTKAKRYHPVVNLFVEGAFSEYAEATLKTGSGVVYKPLGARVVHIKHFLEGDRGRLLQLILNPRLYFRDFAERDEDWAVRFREAVIKFSSLSRGARYLGRSPAVVRAGGGRVLQLVSREQELGVDVLSLLRSYLQPLLSIPRYAVYYSVGESSEGVRVKLASVDVKMHQVLAWSNNAIIVSATPVDWQAYVAGANAGALFTSDHEAVVLDARYSLVSFEPPVTLEYENREERRLKARLLLYNRDFQRRLEEAVAEGKPLEYSGATYWKSLTVSQIAPRMSVVEQYTRLLHVYFLRGLQPITVLERAAEGLPLHARKHVLLRSYIDVIGRLYGLGRTVLVIAQNKKVAEVLREVINATPCSGDVCGEDVNPAKVSHYTSRGRIVLTYFRSRATRGVELPYDFDSVVVVGSPYSRPTTLAHRVLGETTAYTTRHNIPVAVLGYNTGAGAVHLTHIARDFMFGVSELVQAVGRASRSAVRTGKPISVYLPQYLHQRIETFAPGWFVRAFKGLA